jgi:hypothetical protein
LAQENSLRVVIGGTSFQVVQWTASFAINQVPESMCMLAIGRNARNVKQLATAHTAASSLSSMVTAQVFFTPGPGSEFSPDGSKWPQGEQMIFDGYFVGLSYPKIEGKVTIVAHLIHWSVDLGFTSTLSAISHPENPESMTFPAIVQPLPSNQSGSGDPGVWVSQFLAGPSIHDDLTATQDVWAALKNFMCAMSNSTGFQPTWGAGGSALAAAGVDVIKVNNRAARALSRIEGPGSNCGQQGDSGGPAVPNVNYKYGKPLKLQSVTEDQAWYGIANATSYSWASEMVHLTAWDALIGMYCPMFGFDFCPQIDRAIMSASCPGYNVDVWRTLTPDEYDYVDQNGTLPKPLRAVVAHGSVHGETGFNQTEAATSNPSSVAGAFGSKAQSDGDGAIIYVRVPEWIGEICNSASNARYTTGVGNNSPTLTSTNLIGTALSAVNAIVANLDKTVSQMLDQANTLCAQYAQFAFIQNSLRGRVGTISGKLRFDIGPGCYLKILGSPEKFIGAEDGLAATLYGQVNRVTCEIDAEGRRASTSFVISHLRNDKENKDPRTSIDHHPLYGNNVALGAPLLPAYEFPDEPDN